VDGVAVTELGTKVDPETVSITVDGAVVATARERVYILLNKPTGYTTTRSDPHAKRTVMELLGEQWSHLYPVGRLDVDTSGLLILTNDGEFTHLLTHPSHLIGRTYVAVVRGRVASAALRRLEQGVDLDDGLTSPAKARVLSYSKDSDETTLELVIHEGRKRQIRRMMSAVGHPVARLQRTMFGELDMKGVTEGRWRYLTPREVTRLVKSASGSSVRGGRGAR